MQPGPGTILLLALALSIDCLGVGLSYGIRRIRLPWYGSLVLCSCSGIALACSMLIGGWIGQWLPPRLLHCLGAAIMMLLGCAMLARAIQQLVQTTPLEQALFQWTVPGLGIVIQIIRAPERADLDRSGSISLQEALWLGLAMSLDSFGAGIGLAFLGGNPALASLCVAICAWLLFWLGYLSSHWMAQRRWGERLQLLPGCLFFLLGLLRMVV